MLKFHAIIHIMSFHWLYGYYEKGNFLWKCPNIHKITLTMVSDLSNLVPSHSPIHRVDVLIVVGLLHTVHVVSNGELLTAECFICDHCF